MYLAELNGKMNGALKCMSRSAAATYMEIKILFFSRVGGGDCCLCPCCRFPTTSYLVKPSSAGQEVRGNFSNGAPDSDKTRQGF